VNDEEFQLIDSIEESHWWFVGKRSILRALLSRYPSGRRLLDVGCGTGGTLRDWRDRIHCVGIDRSELALKICAKRGFSILARGDLNQLPFGRETFDTVLLLDVLEHLHDDAQILRNASDVCVPGGRLIISVPAFQLLWSQHDETFEHRRRYSARRLEAVIRAAGLTPERTTYTNCLIFPIAALWRLLSYRVGLGRFTPKHDFWSLPGLANRILVRIYEIEARLLARIDLPVGVSVACIARKSL
jgi:SAM-dependent methyltransferase